MEEDYIPFGEEWKKDVMKMTKNEIVDLFKKKCIEFNQLDEKIRLLNIVLNRKNEQQTRI